jgi:hypothetical protein
MSDNVIVVDFGGPFDPEKRAEFLEQLRTELLPNLMLLARDTPHDIPIPPNILMLLLMFLSDEVWGDETKAEFAQRVLSASPSA